MEILLGKLAGFCGGVKRSVIKVEECLKENNRVYCYGELVHNKQVINRLEKMGLVVIDDINDVPNNNIVVFRTHGVKKEIYDIAKNKNLDVLDLTCPKVLKIHESAEKLKKEGYFIILIAQINHSETIGTISFCGEFSFILENEDMLDDLNEKIKISGKDKIAVISQTTFSVDKYNILVEKIKEKFSGYELNINNNICDATDLRQKEMKELANKVDAMVIIGGKNSSNTKKLYDISKNACENSFLIETLNDLPEEILQFDVVGVMAGASTPDDSISEVVKYLKTNNT